MLSTVVSLFTSGLPVWLSNLPLMSGSSYCPVLLDFFATILFCGICDSSLTQGVMVMFSVHCLAGLFQVQRVNYTITCFLSAGGEL